MWKDKNDSCCGNCKYHRSYHSHGNSTWYCDNEVSDNYTIETEYQDECEDFEEK